MRETTPVFINSFNQPTYIMRIVTQLTNNGFKRIIVCDNNSRSRKVLALLEAWEKTGAVQVIRLGANLGPHETFQRILSEQESPFIFSDPDIELPENLAENFVCRLHEISRRYRCRKVGPALEIPKFSESRDITMRHRILGDYGIAEWEQQFWQIEIEKNVYRANLDTTLFYWNPKVNTDFRRQYNFSRNNFRPRRFIKFIPKFAFTDIRVAGEGFTTRHLPWYHDDKMPEDEREFYRQEAARWSTWVQ